MSANEKSSVGRKTSLTKELTFEIRKLYLNGINYSNIRQKLGINENNWDRWVYEDYEGFRVFLNDIKRERLLEGAVKTSHEILEIPFKQKVGNKTTINTNILAIKQREAEFIRLTLGKDDGYAKLNGKNGKKEKITGNIIEFRSFRADKEVAEPPILGEQSVK